MNFMNPDEILAGLKRGAAKFGSRVAESVTKKMATRINARGNGFAPTEPEPYGDGMGGADTAQESQKKNEAPEHGAIPCDNCGQWARVSKGKDFYDCMNECAKKGFAKKVPFAEGEKQNDGDAPNGAVDSSSLGFQSAEKTTTAHREDELMQSKCLACGHESPSAWSGKCDGCGVENEKDVAGNLFNGEFKEEEHPRDGGKFTTKGSGSKSGAPKSSAPKDESASEKKPETSGAPAQKISKEAQSWKDSMDSSSKKKEDLDKEFSKIENPTKEQKDNYRIMSEVHDTDIKFFGKKFKQVVKRDNPEQKKSPEKSSPEKSKKESPATKKESPSGAGDDEGDSTEGMWDDSDQEDKQLVMEQIGLDPGAYMDDKFSDLPAWAQKKIKEFNNSSNVQKDDYPHDAGAGGRAEDRAVEEAAHLENSYGNYDIAGDLKRGMSVQEVAAKIKNRYPEISESQCARIVKQVQTNGPDSDADWEDENKHIFASTKENADEGSKCAKCGKEVGWTQRGGKVYHPGCAPSSKENATHTSCVDCDKPGVMKDMTKNPDGAGYLCDSCVQDRDMLQGPKNKRENAGSRFEVHIGNLGKVYSGDRHDYAMAVFKEYVKDSKSPSGRASGEDVVLMEAGEPIKEYKGTLKNTGHLTGEGWELASLEERIAWLTEAGMDINLATRRFTSLSEDVHVALQKVIDEPKSINNSGDTHVCPECGWLVSAAEFDRGLRSTCPNCKQAIPVETGMENASSKCPNCGGSGEVSYTGDCPECGGSGKYSNASGLQKKFTFRDTNGEEETVEASDEAAAWNKLSADFATPLDELKQMGLKLVRTNAGSGDAGNMREAIVHRYGKELASGDLSASCKKALSDLAASAGLDIRQVLKDLKADAVALGNAKLGEECPSCHLPKKMRPADGGEDSYVCGNRQCKSFKNADEQGDLKEIARHAEGIEHEVGEMLDEEQLKNANPAKFCKRCRDTVGGNFDGKTGAVDKNGTYHVVTSQGSGHFEVACGDEICCDGGELANSIKKNGLNIGVNKYGSNG